LAPELGRLPWRRLRVRGPSMSPALRDGDVVLVRRGVPRPDDVVLVRWPSRPELLSVKRAVRDNGDGTWFVTGDNPFASTDSRELGPAVVVGVVAWRCWPRPGRV
jgi:phage repressor protein C with HTH and peptisase S24 domain